MCDLIHDVLCTDVLQELHPPVTTTPTVKIVPQSSTEEAATPEITVEHPTPPLTGMYDRCNITVICTKSLYADDEREVMELFKASQLNPKCKLQSPVY